MIQIFYKEDAAMNIKEVARIGKILFKKGTTIIEGDPKSKNKEARENVITHAITEFSSFIIVRKLFDEVENFDNKEEENLKFYAQSLKISEASLSVLKSKGFYVIPIYPGIKEFRPLSYGEYDYCIWEEESLFTLEKEVLTEKNMKNWIDYPCDILNTVFQMLNMDWNCESGFVVTNPLAGYSVIKQIVEAREIIKKSRIKIGNSIVNNTFLSLGKREYDNLKETMGIKGDVTQALMKEYKRIKEDIHSKMLQANPKRTNLNITERVFNMYAPKSKIIPDFYKYSFMDIFARLEDIEDDMIKMISSTVHQEKLWKYYLEGISGCGELTAAYILASLNPYKARHPSSFIRYAGMDVRENEEGRRVGVNKSFTRELVYLNKDGEISVKKSLGYDPILKARILGIFVPSAIKAKKGLYAEIYYNAKEYYKNRPDLQEEFNSKKSTRSPHKMAVRKTGHLFLVHLWEAWRRIEGLPLNGGSYEKAKLNIIHNYDTPRVLTPEEYEKENPPKRQYKKSYDE